MVDEQQADTAAPQVQTPVSSAPSAPVTPAPVSAPASTPASTVNDSTQKSFWQSKTKVGALILALGLSATIVLKAAGVDTPIVEAIPQVIAIVGAALGVTGARDTPLFNGQTKTVTA